MPRDLLKYATFALVVGASSGCAAVRGFVESQLSAPDVQAPLVAADLDTIAEIIAMEDRRQLDTARVASWLAASHPDVRGRAARGIGRVGDHAGATLLMQALGDRSAAVRADAAFALGELGDTATAVLDALVAELWTAAGSAAPSEPAVEAVAALGKLGAASPQAQAAVAAALRNGANAEGALDAAPWPRDVTAEALLAAWRLPRTDELLALVRARLADPDVELRWRAAYALFRWGAPAAAQELIARLADGDPLVRALAARGLRAAIVDSAGARGDALAALGAALADPHPHVRISVARAIGSYGDTSQVLPVARLLNDADANVAIAAAEALAGLGPDGAVYLESVAADESRKMALRGAALASLMRLDPARGLARADALLASGEWLGRLYATRAYAAAPWSELSRRSRRLLADSDPRVVASGVQSAVMAAPDTAADAHAFYLESLFHADPVVRANALSGFARRAEPSDLPVLLQAYERAQQDAETNDAAIAAVAALGALQAKGVPAARSFFLRFTRSPDPVVRSHVAARLGSGWGPDEAVVARDAAYYRAVVQGVLVPALIAGSGPRVRIHTATGVITVELLASEAPLTVSNFLSLARTGYFDGGRWHRVVPNFVLQDGDPRGDGSGGPGYSIRDEINRTRYLRGMVGMALSGPDTGGSQFFITHSPQPHLDGGYTIFGRVVDGMAAADAVVQDDPIIRIEVVS